jgi:uncharacterized membrane protein
MRARRAHHAASVVVLALGFIVGVPAFIKPAGAFLEAELVPRLLVAFGLPLTAAAIYFLFRSLWSHDTVRTGNGAFEATYQAIVFRVMVFVVAMHTLLVIALTDTMNVIGSHTWGKRVVVVMFGLTFVAVGNLLPRTRPNIAFGLRTARTLANTQLWQQVHRVGGYAAVAFGALVAIAGMAAPMRDLIAGVIGLAGIAAVIVVLVTYRRYASA